jgi:hypothetical protein
VNQQKKETPPGKGGVSEGKETMNVGNAYFDLAQAVKDKAQTQAELKALLQPLQDQVDQLLLGPLSTKLTDLEQQINTHCVAKADELRRLQGKDTGAATFVDGGFKVTVTLPKTVKWDNDMLADIAERMRANGVVPTAYLKITYAVDERSYKEFEPAVQQALQFARTVSTGKPKIEIKEAK